MEIKIKLNKQTVPEKMHTSYQNITFPVEYRCHICKPAGALFKNALIELSENKHLPFLT